MTTEITIHRPAGTEVTVNRQVTTVSVRRPQVLELRTNTPGARGPQGPEGPTLADLHYAHDQMSASDTWVVTHNLDKYPSVTVIDSAGDVCEGTIVYNSTNQLTLSFSAAFAGMAYIN